MGNYDRLNDFFKKSPDAATKAKIDIFKKYFGIYFKLIDEIKKYDYAKYKPIKYIDLFCGPGYFKSNSGIEPSTPLNVLENVSSKGYNNVSFFFNDYSKEAIELLKKEVTELYGNKYKCTFSVSDARDVDLNLIINSNDITISLIDSFSYLCLDPKTINKLTENRFSDVVCYFRVANILEHMGNASEKNNHITLLGSEEKYNILYRMIKDVNIKQMEKVDFLLKTWIDNINSKGPKKFILPIFINFAGESSKIESVVMILSKNILGLKKVLSMLNDVDVCEGRLFSYDGSSIDRLSLFDFNYDYIKECIKEYSKWMNRTTLIEYIENDFIKKYGYISAYSQKIINEKLRKLESNEEIIIECEGLNSKRKKGTFPDSVFFKLK